MYDTFGLYDMWWNELLISAGLLQWPVYGKSFPKYYNFGSLGVTLAHELVHSVDEIGMLTTPVNFHEVNTLHVNSLLVTFKGDTTCLMERSLIGGRTRLLQITTREELALRISL